MITYAIAVGVADVRRDPDPTSELVTQALMQMPAKGSSVCDEWTNVTLPDYEGWIQSNQLAEPAVKGFTKIGDSCATPLDLIAVVSTTHAPLFADVTGDETLDTVYLSTALPLLDTTQARLQVALPGGFSGWLARDAVTIRHGKEVYPLSPVNVITTYARAFIGVPYLWGGTSYQGIDCSGFVQLCYRMGGYIIPRDADQQHDALTHRVEQPAMQEGDLIFFGHPSIVHVGMALNQREFIHAEGREFNRVVINSLDPADEHYNKRLHGLVYNIKRVIS
ncbi:MAG TPA: C40 family peptidase [Ktedonobacteraceae bacterium]